MTRLGPIPGGRLDVIVVGGGPAGSVTARQLALDGWRVLVLEREHFPRPKVCGEYLCPAAVTLLEELGLSDALEGIPQRRVTRVRIASPSGEVVEGGFVGSDGRDSHGLSLPRSSLDQALLGEATAAGAVVVERARVSDIRVGSDGVEVDFRLPGQGLQTARGALVIGADGRFSTVARRLGLDRPRREGGRAVLHGQFAGAVAPARSVEMHLLAGRRYAGVNFLPDGIANVSLVVDLAELKSLDAAGRERFLREVLATAPALRERFSRARAVEKTRVLAPLRVERSRAHGERMMLVGDAAGFLDPLTGEGVHVALITSRLAAETADRALRRERFGAEDLADYTRRRRRLLRPKSMLNRGLQWLLRHPGLQDWLGRRFGASPECSDVLVSVIGNTRTPRALLSPGFLRRFLMHRAPSLGPPTGIDAAAR